MMIAQPELLNSWQRAPESLDDQSPESALLEISAIARCPVTYAPLRPANARELDHANARACQRQLWHRDGTPVHPDIHAGLVTHDGRFLYIFSDGVAFLMAGYAIDLARQAAPPQAALLRSEKQNLRSFYDELGWLKDSDGEFKDASLHEDLRAVAADYIRKCHQRVNRFLAPKGRYLLDVASGPVQYSQYIEYSRGYQRRICVDISFRALAEARKKLAGRGLYILGDITNLPLIDCCMDGFVSLHTIYHVPADEQRAAFLELYRVLRSGRSGVVVYQQRNGPLNRLLMGPVRLLRNLKHAVMQSGTGATAKVNQSRIPSSSLSRPAAPYCHFHPRSWFTSQGFGFRIEFRVWRTLGVPAIRLWIQPRLCGRLLLRILHFLEEMLPFAFGRIGEYWLLVIRRGSLEVS
jgi:SAM-dependent methyltransferase